ncbi:elongation factor G [Spirochaeta lutea]|uniref:Elongation factor G n=1 Tax=Spirochaeta lutea TaxID=1480694 RepID=A0A098R1L7_9SPIO|nr:elongation factor G [Spirochaeta lutea]KGE73681.1 GTP-binding protein [Spirochaeta lutea]
MSYSTEDIRNIAVAGHGGTGKTTFVENLLFSGDQIEKSEPVESGRSVSDFTEEEIDHKMSIHTTLSHIFWKGHKINILDTPGASDFVGEVIAAFRTAESAVMLVDSQAGVEIETLKLWRRLDKRNKPRIVFVNKMDQPRADFNTVLEDIRTKLGDDKKPFIPITIPIGAGEDFRGIIDLIHMKAYMVHAPGEKERESEIPEDMRELAQEFHEAMIEAAAVGDDELMEKYLEEEDLTVDEAIRGLTEGLVDNKLTPVFCGAALLNTGVSAILDFLNIAAPSPAGIDEIYYDDEHTENHVAIHKDDFFSAFSFKTSIDQYAGKLSYIKVVTGSLRSDVDILNTREHKKERISKIYMCQGKKLEEVDELFAGDLGIIAKIASAHTNDSFCSPEKNLYYKPLQLPQPVHSIAISASTKKDQDKLAELLQKATEEDKTLNLSYNKETHETVFSGMGELHINLVLEKIKKSTKMEIQTSTPRVAFRETMTIPADAEYTHKKQTGGHGQYARVVMKFAPLPRGEQFKFANEIKGGAISRGYMPGIEKGLLEGMEEGIVAGYPVVDVEATVIDGKEHPVDSSEMAFKLAARGALREALGKGKCTLLEPIMELHVFIDEQYLGDVLSDLSSKRGRVLGQESLGGGIMEISAEVPQSELLRYSIDLRSITSGTGSFEMNFVYYNPISGKAADDVVKQAQLLNSQE